MMLADAAWVDIDGDDGVENTAPKSANDLKDAISKMIK